ncbi:N-acetylmuramic acid 6-phosphate etherase, partial [Candidatus Sumerlaeota bacterium]|nr:N-acetylmuramic acid 6-phosphate etherase [Candidatus Sumerlaeota bacterium]
MKKSRSTDSLPPKRHAERLTEQRNPRTMAIDRASITDALAMLHAEDRECFKASEAAAPSVAQAIELVVAAFRRGGRLIYIGAGTSGRLGVLDASEQPPTFGVSPEMVQGIIAGGADALVRSIEGAEDRPEDGAAAIDGANAGEKDVV